MNEPRRMRSGRASRIAAFGLLFLTLTFALGNRACNDGVPEIACNPVPLVLAPGECKEIPNPCSEHGEGWALPPDIDGFKLDPQGNTQLAVIAAEQFSLTTTRAGDDVVRTVCVGDNAPFISQAEVDYFYGHGTRFGLGAFRLTVSNEFKVTVTASPANIAVGEDSQLLASVSGGIGPYFYFWVPNIGLNSTHIAAPVASPHATTEYQVGVSDSSGQFVSGSVTVFVRAQVTVTADPPEITAGDVCQLNAIVEGGTPPYTYSWTPVDSLNDPHESAPLATPTVTTTYQVTAMDSLGATRTGSIQVFVADERLDVSPSATPSSIRLGETSQLNAIARGGFPPYSYRWDPADSLDNPTIPNPIATPLSSQSYRITVTDSKGLSIFQVAGVQVLAAAPPVASFVFHIGSGPSLILDASASTGNIVSYTWDLSWTPKNPDQVTSSPSTAFAIRETDNGTITLTVTNAAGQTATTTRPF